MSHGKDRTIRKFCIKHMQKQTLDKLYFWDDLQEVIMLPPMDSFREAEFTELFVTLGTLAKPKTLTELWFEAISGRIKEDTLNYTHAFFLLDTEHICLWVQGNKLITVQGKAKIRSFLAL